MNTNTSISKVKYKRIKSYHRAYPLTPELILIHEIMCKYVLAKCHAAITAWQDTEINLYPKH